MKEGTVQTVNEVRGIGTVLGNVRSTRLFHMPGKRPGHPGRLVRQTRITFAEAVLKVRVGRSVETR